MSTVIVCHVNKCIQCINMYLFVYILPIEIHVKNQNHKLTDPTPRHAVEWTGWFVD